MRPWNEYDGDVAWNESKTQMTKLTCGRATQPMSAALLIEGSVEPARVIVACSLHSLISSVERAKSSPWHRDSSRLQRCMSPFPFQRVR